MNLSTQNFDRYVFSKHPDYDEAAVRKEFAKAVPLKTVVIYCYVYNTLVYPQFPDKGRLIVLPLI